MSKFGDGSSSRGVNAALGSLNIYRINDVDFRPHLHFLIGRLKSFDKENATEDNKINLVSSNMITPFQNTHS